MTEICNTHLISLSMYCRYGHKKKIKKRKKLARVGKANITTTAFHVNGNFRELVKLSKKYTETLVIR